MRKTVTVQRNLERRYLRPPILQPEEVEVLAELTIDGLEFVIHKSLDGSGKKYSVTEVSTGCKLGDSDCVAGNGNVIPAGLQEFTEYCKETIPKTTWLKAAVDSFLRRLDS